MWIFFTYIALNYCFFYTIKRDWVYCVVRKESLHIIQVKFCLTGRAMTQAISRQPLNAEDRVPSQASPYEIYGWQSGTVFLRHYHSISAPNLYSSTCCSHQKNKKAKPGNVPKRNVLSDIGEHWIEMHFQFFYRPRTKHHRSVTQAAKK